MVVVGCCEDPFRPPLRGASLAMVVGKVVVVVQSDCNCNGDGQWWSRLNPSYYVFSGTPWDMGVNVTVFASSVLLQRCDIWSINWPQEIIQLDAPPRPYLRYYLDSTIFASTSISPWIWKVL